MSNSQVEEQWVSDKGAYPPSVKFSLEGSDVRITSVPRSRDNLVPSPAVSVALPLSEFKKLIIKFMREARA